MLPPVLEIPSVVTMQRQREEMLLCQDLIPRSYSVCLWHDELRMQCMITLKEETYSSSKIQSILLNFLSNRMSTLTNASIILNLRRPIACGIQRWLEDAVTSIAHEYEQAAEWQQQIASNSKPWHGMEQACSAHLMWLLHRHHAWHQISRCPPSLDSLFQGQSLCSEKLSAGECWSSRAGLSSTRRAGRARLSQSTCCGEHFPALVTREPLPADIESISKQLFAMAEIKNCRESTYELAPLRPDWTLCACLPFFGHLLSCSSLYIMPCP
jgi:hypothetical protein